MKSKSAIFVMVALILTTGLLAGALRTHAFELIDPPITIQVSQKLFLPYNIKAKGWWTGLHIAPPSNSSLPIIVEFYHGDNPDPYARSGLIEIYGHEGWTGNVEALLPRGARFKSPSNLNILSDRRFTVTKFIGNTSLSSPGFGFQTFYSYRAIDDWPHPD